MVAFQEDPEHYNTNLMMGHLDAQIDRTIQLEKKLRGLDEIISLTPAYVQRVRHTTLLFIIILMHLCRQVVTAKDMPGGPQGRLMDLVSMTSLKLAGVFGITLYPII